jgi:hypothetical protein
MAAIRQDDKEKDAKLKSKKESLARQDSFLLLSFASL